MKRDLELEALVIDEATKLKQFATPVELLRLHYENLAGSNREYCIYGMMAGDCENSRAIFLMEKCAQKVYVGIKGKELNGLPKKEILGPGRDHFSPIEVFLYRYKWHFDNNSTKIRKLVKFLKGEIDELKF